MRTATTTLTTPICVGLLALGMTGLGCKNTAKTNDATEVDKAATAEDTAKPAEKPAAAEKTEGDRALLAQGATAPDFSTVAHDGTKVDMKELRGKPVVLYFYPKDDTPG